MKTILSHILWIIPILWIDIYVVVFFSALHKTELIPDDLKNISYLTGVINLQEIKESDYIIFVKSEGKNIEILCSGLVQKFGRRIFCRLDEKTVNLINGKNVTVGWYKIPAVYWYPESGKQLYSITMDNNVVYQKLSVTSDIIRQRQFLMKILIFSLLFLTHLVIFYAIYYKIHQLQSIKG